MAVGYVKVDTRGRITLPKRLREDLGIALPCKFLTTKMGNMIIMKAVRSRGKAVGTAEALNVGIPKSTKKIS